MPRCCHTPSIRSGFWWRFWRRVRLEQVLMIPQDMFQVLSTLRVQNGVRFIQRHPVLASQLVCQRACSSIPDSRSINGALRAMFCIFGSLPSSLQQSLPENLCSRENDLNNDSRSRHDLRAMRHGELMHWHG